MEVGITNPSERVICVITGSGLKDVKTARGLVKGRRDVEIPLRMGLTKLRVLEVLSEGKLHGYGIEVKLPSVYQHLSELTALGLTRALDVEEYRGEVKVLRSYGGGRRGG